MMWQGISVAIWQTCTLIRAKEAKSGGSLKKRQNFLKQAGNERSYAFALRDVAKTWAFDDSLSLALHYMLIADSVITRFQDLRGEFSSIY